MKTIAYICSYDLDYQIATEELNKQTIDIQNYCKNNNFELSEVFTETSTRDDFKPVLLNIMSNYFGVADKLIIQHPDVISRNEDFRAWISDEFKRMNIEIIFLSQTEEVHENTIERNLPLFRDKIKNLPSLPEIITKSIELMQDKNSSAYDLSNIISKDIGLTARVLKLVNSAYYGFPKQISTIQQAITILGFTTIKGVILSASIFKMFTPQRGQTFNYKRFWKHSLLVATASKLIANETDLSTKDDIFAAAFLYNIGKIVLAQYDWENYSKIDEKLAIEENDFTKQEEKYCGLNHCEIGNMVAFSWNLPEIFCEIITYHHTPENSFTNHKECAIVYIANEIVKLIMSNKNLNNYNIPLKLLENLHVSADNINIVYETVKELASNVNDINNFLMN